MRVLIADDDPTQLRALEALVTSWGYDPILARNGTEAWHILESTSAPRLAVLDAMMPGMDGFEIVRKAREKDWSTPPYLIMLSALDSRHDVIKALEDGANDYVKKPADAAELRARMQVGARVVDLQERLAQRLSDMRAAIAEPERAETENLRLRSAIDQASEGVIITDCNGTIQYVNAAFTAMSGYTRDQILGRSPRVLKSGTHGEAFYSELWGTIRAGQVWTGELTNRRADGTLYNEQMTITPLRDSSGLITNYVAFKRDITSQKAAEAHLVREQALVRTLMDNVPDAIYFKDISSRFLRVNSALARRLAISDPTLAIGRKHQDFFPSGSAQQEDSDDERIMATQQPIVSKEERETWPDGSVTWATSTKMPLRGPDGAIIGTFGISRDITQRKESEDALRENEQKYRLQSSLLHAIYDVSPDGILMVDGKGTILSHNHQFLEIWQLDVPDAIGCDDEPILAKVAAQVKNPEEFRRRVAALYADPNAKDHCEIELKDGRTLDRISAGLRDSEGEYQGRVWFFRDITERKHSEETRNLAASIVQFSDDAIFGLRNATIVSWNRGAELIYGYSEEEVKGRHVSMLAPPDRRNEQSRMRETIARGERISNLETVRLTKDGRRIHVSLSISPITNAAGEVVSESVVARDISGRKRAESAQAEEARLAVLRAEVGAALTGRGSLRAGLQACTDALVRGTGVQIARIWTLEAGESLLVLEASSGMDTRVDGMSARVPVGRFKVGRIAQTLQPLLSNVAPTLAEGVGRKWANREQMVGFVGYPLVVGDDVMGVVAAWASHPLTQTILLAFSSIAKQVA